MDVNDSPQASGCPFHAQRVTAPASNQGRVYKRPFGILHNAGVRREIASLDAARDCQRIAYLLSNYEFPFDLIRANELALFHTYGSRSIARLLDKTGEFAKRGQKRYDDTTLLILSFVEAGWASDQGQRSIAQMNKIHGHFSIPNEDFLFVLWTFIDFPIQWLNEFGWRKFTAHEQLAWFNFWVGIGKQMNLTDIPPTKAAFDCFVADYEQRELVYAEASQRVAESTMQVLAAMVPAPLRFAVAPIAYGLVRPQLLPAIGAKAPAPWLQKSVYAALKVRSWVKRVLSIEAYPVKLNEKKFVSYPDSKYILENVGPSYAHRDGGVKVSAKAAQDKVQV